MSMTGKPAVIFTTVGLDNGEVWRYGLDENLCVAWVFVYVPSQPPAICWSEQLDPDDFGERERGDIGFGRRRVVEDPMQK